MKKIFNYTLLLASLFLLLVQTKTYAQPAFIKDSLSTFIEREMARWQVPGLAIAIVKDGKIVHCQGYGVKDIQTKEKVNEYSLFQIASNSKAFTGTAIALLDYQKKLSLDEKVTTYMPSFKLYEPTSTQLCTVRDLLCHRIGHGTFQGDFLNWGSTLSRADIIAGMGRTVPKYDFRYKYGYCNAGFITAGEIIPIVTGMSWDAYLDQTFFKPLQMKHTHTSYELMKNDKNACTPHTMYLNKLQTIPLTNIENMGPSASINSCAADMANWLLMQLNKGQFNNMEVVPNKVLLETRKSNMVSNDVSSKIFPTKHFVTYGLGWQSYDYEGKRVFEHSGGANGFVTKTEYIPEENLGVLVYTNSDANSLYDALVKQVLEAYLNVPYRNISEIYYTRTKAFNDQEAKDLDSLIALSNKKMPLPINAKNFEGTYSNSLYGEMTVQVEKGKLVLHLSHHPNNIGTLKYIGNNQFLCFYSDITCGIEILPFTIEDNKVKSIEVKVADFIDYERYLFNKQ